MLHSALIGEGTVAVASKNEATLTETHSQTQGHKTSITADHPVFHRATCHGAPLTYPLPRRQAHARASSAGGSQTSWQYRGHGNRAQSSPICPRQCLHGPAHSRLGMSDWSTHKHSRPYMKSHRFISQRVYADLFIKAQSPEILFPGCTSVTPRLTIALVGYNLVEKALVNTSPLVRPALEATSHERARKGISPPSPLYSKR